MKTILQLCAGTCLLLSGFIMQAQTFQNYTTLSTSTTLCNDEVRGICIDNEGRKWFATSEGISVYDGINWETHSKATGLGDKVTHCIAKDSKGNIWVGTNVTVCRVVG